MFRLRVGFALVAAVGVLPLHAGGGSAADASHMPPRFEGYRIALADARRGVMSATRPNVPCPRAVCPFYVYSTANGGRTWRRTLRAVVSAGRVAELAAAPGSGVFWAAFPCDPESACRSSVFRSDDGGRRWRRVSRAWLYLPSFASPRYGWALGLGGVPTGTRDGGRTWRPIPNEPCPAGFAGYMHLARVSARRGWALCYDDQSFPDNVAVVETRDGGRKWHVRAAHSRFQPPTGRGLEQAFALRNLSFTASGRGWIWRWAGGPLVTSDGGRTWRPATRRWPFSPRNSALTWGSAPSGAVAGAIVSTTTQEMVATTANTGRTWRVVHRTPR